MYPLSASCLAAQKGDTSIHGLTYNVRAMEGSLRGLSHKDCKPFMWSSLVFQKTSHKASSHRKEAIPLVSSLSSVIIGLLISLCSHISFYTLQLSSTMSNQTNYNFNQQYTYASQQYSDSSQYSHNSGQQNPSLGLRSSPWEDPEYLDFLYRYVKPRLFE